jgi:hypothetical protein
MGIIQAVRGYGVGLSVSASSVSASGSGFIGCGNAGSTNTPGTSVSGGSGNYSFLWERVGAAATRGPWIISSATVQNPSWHAPGPVCDGDSVISESWKVWVTDNSTGQIGSATISVTISWANLT